MGKACPSDGVPLWRWENHGAAVRMPGSAAGRLRRNPGSTLLWSWATPGGSEPVLPEPKKAVSCDVGLACCHPLSPLLSWRAATSPLRAWPHSPSTNCPWTTTQSPSLGTSSNLSRSPQTVPRSPPRSLISARMLSMAVFLALTSFRRSALRLW